MIDYVTLRLGVQSWAQSVGHGENWPAHRFSCVARTDKDEDLRLTGGPSILTLNFHLSMLRGEYMPRENEPPLERGIGILAFAEAREPCDDIPGSDAFCHGWWWMPDTLYDEAWNQVRANTFQYSAIEIDIAPIEYGTLHFHWDVKKKMVISVLRASVRFDRKRSDPPLPPEPPRRRGLFG